MQTIKVTTTDKGKLHWERYLIAKQELRLNKLLIELDTDPWVKRGIFKLFKRKVTKDNIIPLVSHPIKTFLNALIEDELIILQYTSTCIIPKK